MSQLISIRPGRPAQKKQASPPRKTPTLLDAPGVVVNEGLTIEWAATNIGATLTPQEVVSVAKDTGVRNPNTVKIMQIKALMRTKTCGQIVAHFRGRRGYSKRTVERYHAALSKCGGGGK